MFCRIVSGEEKAEIVHEDEQLLGFLDLAPLNRGHSLLIPKQHYSSVAAMPPELQGRMLSVATRLAVAVSKAVDADGFNLLIANGTCAGQVVRHAHIHVVPRFPLDGLAIPPVADHLPDRQDQTAVVAAIRKRMHHEA